MKKIFIGLVILGLTVTLLSAVQPAAARVRAGILRCDVGAGVGYLVGSRKDVDCVYTSANGRWREHYVGHVTHVGLDVGFTEGGKVDWAVYAPSRRGPGALAGVYGGATAEATVSGGVGANVLVGGLERSISLQPISVGAQRGFNLALAVSGLELELVR